MGAEPIPVLVTGCKCSDCFIVFDIVTTLGVVNLCPACNAVRIAEIFADTCGHHVLPADGQAVTCGLRADRTKKQRRHHFTSLGMDTRNLGDKGFYDVEIFACIDCGRDAKGSSSDANAVESNPVYVSTLFDLDNHVKHHDGCNMYCRTFGSMILALPGEWING